MARRTLVLAGVFGLLAVVAGTFGAHVLEGRVTGHQLDIFDTAQRYHMYHALALLGCAVLAGRVPSKRLEAAVSCFTSGIVLFAGSLYALALTGLDWLGMIAPVGGTLLIVGWALLIAAAFGRAADEDASTGELGVDARGDDSRQVVAMTLKRFLELDARQQAHRRGGDGQAVVPRRGAHAAGRLGQ